MRIKRFWNFGATSRPFNVFSSSPKKKKKLLDRLEHPHQWMHNFCKFTHLKHTFFYFTLLFLLKKKKKKPTSVYLLYIFIRIKYSFLNQHLATINAQSSGNHQPASIKNPHNHHHQASLHHQPTIKIPKPLIKIIKTH